jgi:hypothetical protein
VVVEPRLPGAVVCDQAEDELDLAAAERFIDAADDESGTGTVALPSASIVTSLPVNPARCRRR